MGVLAEKFKKAKEEYQAFLKEPSPDPAMQQAQYFDYRKRERVVKRKHDHVGFTFRTFPFQLEQVKTALEKVLDQDQIKELQNYDDDMRFKIARRNYIREHHPELIQGLSQEEKKEFNDSLTVAANHFKKWCKEGKISQEEFDTLLAEYYMGEVNSKFSLKNGLEEKFVDAIDEVITEEQTKEILEKIDNYKDPLDIPEEEKVTHPYKDQVEELSKKIPLEILQDPEKMDLYKGALDYASEHLTKPNPAVRREGLDIDRDDQKIEAMHDQYVKRELLPTYEGGKYHEIFQDSENNRKLRIVKEGKEKDYQELRQNGIQLSEKSKDGLRRMLKKMEEMGLEKYPYDATGEDGQKIYGFNKLLAQKLAFTAALDEGNPEKIIQTKQAYEKTVKDMEELYQIARETFPQNRMFPGNMDSIRNENLPIELTSDMRNTAYVNTAFQAYVNIKKNDISVEKYLQNPIDSIVKNAEQKLQEKCFATVSQQANSLEETMDLMSRAGKFSSAVDQLQVAVPHIGFGREIAMPKYLEVDPEMRARNDVAAYDIFKVMFEEVAKASEASKFDYFTTLSKRSALENQKQYETLGNLILAKDQDRKPSAMFAGCPETNFLGEKVGEGFDAENYIKQTPVDYDGIINRAHRVQKHAEEIAEEKKKTAWLSEKVGLEATRQLYTKILLAHPEDIEKKGYKKMQQDLHRTLDRLAELDQEDLGALAEENKEIVNNMLQENRKNYLIHDQPVEELRRLEKEARSSGDFSKYAAFMVDVESHLEELQPEVTEAYSNYQDEILAVNGKGKFVKGEEFYQKLCHAMNEIEMEAGTKFAMESEELAAKIRNGEATVDVAFEDMKKDYHSSKLLANQMLVGSEANQAFRGATRLGVLLEEKSPVLENGERMYFKNREQQELEFYRDGKVAGSAAERRHYLQDVQNSFGTGLESIDTYGSTTAPESDKIDELLKKNADKARNYCSDLEDLKYEAQTKLNAMNEAKLGGREGSDQYVAIYDALEAVTRLNASNTPAEVEQAIENVRSTAGDYQKKIEEQGIFARFQQKGKDRYDFAAEVEQFGNDKILEFSEKSQGKLAMNERLEDQINRALDNQLAFALKQAKEVVQEKEAQQVEKASEAAQKEAEEYLKSAKDAEKALSGMEKGIEKPAGHLWEEKMDAFVKVATAKEIERRGGLKEGETIQTVQKELFGEKEARDAMTQMMKEYDGKHLITLAGKQEIGKTLKAYQEKQKSLGKEKQKNLNKEQQKNLDKEQPEKKGPADEKKKEKQPKKLEKEELQRKRANSLELRGPKID